MNPVLAEVWRGNKIESIHRGAVIALGSNGEPLYSAGDTEAMVFPRSAIKPIQALPLVESGAADAYQLTDQHIALACASHNGEPLHTELVLELLENIGLDKHTLVCGAEHPMRQQAALDLARQQQDPERQHHNCSGKHSGMLTLTQHMGWGAANYNAYDHPSQQAWRQALSELCDIDAEAMPWDFDGCGIPALAMPLKNIARGFYRFANPDTQSPTRAHAMKRIQAAIAAHPMNIAGTERSCTAVVNASQGRIIVKIGAEGVYTGMIPGRGIGFALKIDDGAGRAAETALGGLLEKLGEPVANHPETRPFFKRKLKNSQGKVVGKIIPAPLK